MKKSFITVSKPSLREKITLRLMIIMGTMSIGYLLYRLCDREQIGYAPYYYLLMVAIVISCLRILHEWYHYFSISISDEPGNNNKTFTVDIFTTYCDGEPKEMVERTLEAIVKIQYPHTSYLCDEANDPYLKSVCERLNVIHITRSNRIDAKAGNINNALKFAKGDLCVILDPDHIPRPEFLEPIIPHFRHPETGFVQIVQAYYNPGETLVAKGAAQQTFQFYGPIMMSMNSYGTVQAIGANCTFRRSALDSIDGHAAGLAEDMHTALQLHAKGWKSVYVPAVLARGLVPSSLSAYYAQQLKWSRGTFEIFVTSFLRLFFKLNWRQKIHYATTPLYYLSGFVVLINILIPVLALSTGLIPLRFDILEFALLGIPVVASAILIRHYVQRWVMEEWERGFHVIGGILQIGTWWIYVAGFFYTIFRKKVPYIPTPKNNTDPDSWLINLPNALMVLVSLVAIIFGLNSDFNPYSVVMAAIAVINCVVLTSVIVIGRADNKNMSLSDRHPRIGAAMAIPLFLKKQFWIFRHTLIYRAFRVLGLPLLTMAVFMSWYLLYADARPPGSVQRHPADARIFYTGIYNPGENDDLVAIEDIKGYQRINNTQFNIISLYISWGDQAKCYLPESLLNEIYQDGAIPMITWEPWSNLFTDSSAESETENGLQILKQIVTGKFDRYLEKFSLQVKALRRPVFIRFAHEPDNPDYPWSVAGNNTPGEYKAAWQYVYNYFLRKGIVNVNWVWNPWKSENADQYYPGDDYVDWLGVTGLNYAYSNSDTTGSSFTDLYKPFHQHAVFRSGKPVMISEFGSLAGAHQTDWLHSAFADIEKKFPEIKAIIFFNSDRDGNVPANFSTDVLNWKISKPDSVFTLLRKNLPFVSQQSINNPPVLNSSDSTEKKLLPLNFKLPLQGSNYNTGKNWYRNYHELTSRRLYNDFRDMDSLGINTIRRFGPGIYDKNLLNALDKTNINLMYAFWVPDFVNEHAETQQLDETRKIILETVNRLRKHKKITAWSLGNTGQVALRTDTRPGTIYKQERLMNWLNELIFAIKELDPTRPVTIDVTLSAHIHSTLVMLQNRIRATDAFGIIINNDTTGIARLADIEVPYYISSISPENLLLISDNKRLPVFLASYQDQHTRNFISFDGIIDHWGRRKPGYAKIQNMWHRITQDTTLPQVKILRPSRTVFVGRELIYNALVRSGDEWRFTDDRDEHLRFEWHLVKFDEDGQAVYMRSAGTGASLRLTIPESPEHYRLYLQVISGDRVDGTQSVLNLPLLK